MTGFIRYLHRLLKSIFHIQLQNAKSQITFAKLNVFEFSRRGGEKWLTADAGELSKWRE